MTPVAECRQRLRRLRKYHLALCLIGFVLSAYSVYVEINLEKDPNYTALCDISPGISCTAVFGSKWGKGFGFLDKIVGENSTLNQPNAVYGMISYPVFTFTSRFEFLFLTRIHLLIGIAGVFLSAYLAYILYYVLGEFCVICITIYVINFLLLILSIMYYRSMRTLCRELDLHNRPAAPVYVEKKRV